LALNYGSRQEVLDAIHSFSQSASQMGQKPEWDEFAQHLQTRDLPDPDLIIRTSGEFRLSNFLLLQAAYSEIYVSPLHWPDFDRTAFIDALRDYISRERRFGKTSEQLFSLQSN
jgi:undecaprenyl diphosphate synthase